jgi:hypothetical protein
MVGLALSREGERLDDGQEHAPGPRRGAGHGRRDAGLTDGKPVGQPQRAAPEPLDEVCGEAVAEAGFDEPAREEEGDDDEPNDLVGEGGEGGGEGERVRGDGGREPEEGPRADGERAQHEPRDGGEEDGEELPCLQAHLGGPRHEEPHGEADGHGDDERDELRAGGCGLGLGVRIRCLGREDRQEGAAARDGGEAMMMRGVVWEGEGGVWEGPGVSAQDEHEIPNI